jgi:hypothetical protein
MQVAYMENPNLRAITREGLTLVRYVKPLADPALGMYRSVIFKDEKLISFTPPKSVDYAAFSAKYPLQDVRVEEFMDGTMVYAYFDGVDWRVGTRSVYDADTTYRCGMHVPQFNKTGESLERPRVPCVRDLFMAKVGGPSFFEALRESCVYVFSFMNPLSFNVLKGDAVYLTAVYEIQGNEARLVDGGVLPPVVLYPKKYTFTTYETLAECADEVPYTCKGFMLHAGGERTKLVSSAFTYVKNLLDNQPNINSCLLKLMREHNETFFLEVYPEYRANAAQLHANIKAFTNALYSSYMDCFCDKAKPLREYPGAFKQHMYQLHKHYLTTLRPAKKRVNKQEVVLYVAGLHHNQLGSALSL